MYMDITWLYYKGFLLTALQLSWSSSRAGDTDRFSDKGPQKKDHENDCNQGQLNQDIKWLVSYHRIKDVTKFEELHLFTYFSWRAVVFVSAIVTFLPITKRDTEMQT